MVVLDEIEKAHAEAPRACGAVFFPGRLGQRNGVKLPWAIVRYIFATKNHGNQCEPTSTNGMGYGLFFMAYL